MAATSDAVLVSARASLAFQVLLTAITASSFVLPRKSDQGSLFLIVALETGSQVVEFTYYAVALCWAGSIQTWTRYVDWVISTPVMLLSTMLFLCYLTEGDGVDFSNLWESDEKRMATIGTLTLNWATLALGLAYELEWWASPTPLALGMLTFLGSFAFLLVGYVRGTGTIGIALFLFMYVVWGLYGVAATQSYRVKNIGYNLLDIVSKNFYGIVLFLYILIADPIEPASASNTTTTLIS